jgi:spore coat protein U-like protein
MKTIKLITLTAVAALAAASTLSAAQNTASASANATARIITPISISKTADLNFGDVVPSGVAGTVTVTSAGVRSSAGGASLGNGTGVTAAAFTVSGQASATYAITLPASTTITSGANSMTVDTFTSNPSGTGALSAGGTQPLAVGANLNVGINQAPGTYTGTFSVTVAYN